MKTQIRKIGATAALCLGFVLPGHAATIDLAGVNNYVTYGDAKSYSLPIANLVSGTSNYSVQSSPGQISNLVVIATGSGGNPVNQNFAGMDDAFATPSGNSPTFFSTGTSTEPGTLGVNAGFTGDVAKSWDSTLGAMKTFLAGDNMVFFFNNNQTNSAHASQADQSLAAWMRITLTDSAGQIGAYELTNRGGKYDLVSQGGGGVFLGNPNAYTAPAVSSGPLAGTNASTDYILSGGAICMDGTYVPVPCSGPHAYGPINHNLGANDVAYGVVFDELNTQLQTLFAGDVSGYSMHVDLRLGCDPGTLSPAVNCVGRDLNSGFEQLFIGTLARTPSNVPEPAPIALIGLGMLAFVMSVRRRSARIR